MKNIDKERDRPRRVLHVTGSFNRGGIETWLRQVLPHIPRNLYESDICTYRFAQGQYEKEFKGMQCTEYHIPLGSSPWDILRFSLRFRRLLRSRRYEVVHCHGLLFVGFLLFLAWIEGTPVRIAHAHSSRRITSKRMSWMNRIGIAVNRRITLAFLTHGIACSDEAGTALFGGAWKSNPQCSLIHCGIDLSPFQTDPASHFLRAETGFPKCSRIIGHVSNFSVAKNTGFLVEVVAKVMRNRGDVVLFLVGDGAGRRDLELKCVVLGIRNKVCFLGTSSRVPALMKDAMDVFLMPSIYEGLPLVLLEAQAAGLPCLVSQAVSREAMVSPGAIEFLSLAEGIDVWAERTEALLDAGRQSGEYLKKLMESDFNVTVSAAKLREVYESATKDMRGGITPCRMKVPQRRLESSTQK